MNWAVVATAPDQLTAELWVGLLEGAGVPAMVNPADAVSFLGVSGAGCRVMVAAERLEEARDLLVAQAGRRPPLQVVEPPDDEPPAA